MPNIDKEIVKAFRRLERVEKRRRQKWAEEIREREQAEMREAAAQLHRRRKRLERITLGATVLFTGLILLGVWYARPDLIKDTYRTIIRKTPFGASARISDLDCSSPRAKVTQRCQERREREESTDDHWENLSLYHKGKTTPFTLHRKRQWQEKMSDKSE